MGEVADLFASLGLHVNEAEWATGDAAIDRARKQLLKYEVAAQQRADRAQRSAARAVNSMAREAEQEVKAKEMAGQKTARLAQSLGDRAAKDAAREDTRKERQSAQAARAIRQLDAEQQRGQKRSTAEAKKAADEVSRAQQRAAKESEQASAQAASRVAGMGALLGGLALYLGGRAVKAGIEFNSTMEDSKIQIAGMFALAKHTKFNDELSTAGGLMERLRERAAALPGTTSEYISMLGMIVQPITDAKLGLKDLEDMTVNAVVAAKGLKTPWEVAARDIDQAIRGQFHSVDPFSGKVLGSLGYKGEEGRSRFNSMSQEKRATEYRRALLQPQFTDMSKAQGKSFSGITSTLKDTFEMTLGQVAKPLFDALGEAIERVNKFLETHKAEIAEVADKIGTVLVGAFDAVSAVINFFIEHGDLAMALLIAIGATLAGLAILWIAGFWPVFVVIAAVTALIYGLRKLMNYPGGMKQAFADAWSAIKDGAKAAWEAIKGGFKSAFEFVADLPVVKQLLAVVKKIDELTSKKSSGGGDEHWESDSWLRKLLILPGVAPIATGSAGAETNATRTISGGYGPQASVQIQSVDVGGISVNAPNADAGAVADLVGKHFDEKLGNILRKTMDAVA